MASRGNTQAQTASVNANADAGNYAANAGNIFSDLAPTLETQIAHPAGMSPTDLAAANTAAQQSAGGAEGAAVGQGALRAARTRNAGGGAAAIGSAARGAGQALSQAALKTQLTNAEMKRQEQAQAESGLGNLFSTNVAGGNQALGEVASNVNANTNAENASWDWAKDLLDPALSAGSSAFGNIVKLAQGGGGGGG